MVEIAEPTPADDIIDKQERVEAVIDQRIAAALEDNGTSAAVGSVQCISNGTGGYPALSSSDFPIVGGVNGLAAGSFSGVVKADALADFGITVGVIGVATAIVSYAELTVTKFADGAQMAIAGYNDQALTVGEPGGNSLEAVVLDNTDAMSGSGLTRTNNTIVVTDAGLYAIAGFVQIAFT